MWSCSSTAELKRISRLVIGRDHCEDLPGVIKEVLRERAEAQRLATDRAEKIERLERELQNAIQASQCK